MLDAVLTKKKVSFKLGIAVKTLVSMSVIALAVVLPQIVHIALGATGGMLLMPMYLPVLIGGCVLGLKWGLGVGVLSPIVSFLITLAVGDPMPAVTRLPYMVAELAVFAAVSGAFSGKISRNAWMAFPAVLLASVSGRCVFLIVAAIFQSVSPLTVEVVWSQIQAGLPALVAQAVAVPSIVMGLSLIIDRKSDEK